MTMHSSVSSDPRGVKLGVGLEKRENPVHASLARIAEDLRHFGSPFIVRGTPLVVYIMTSSGPRRLPKRARPPLALFGWAGEGRLIREALPHFDRIESIGSPASCSHPLGLGTVRSIGQAVGDA